MKRYKLMKIYKNILLKIICELDIEKTGRKNKFENKFYLNYIFRILFYGEYWNTFYCPECDRSTIRKKFYKWRNIGIFNEALKRMQSIYYKNRTFKYLFIDSAIIQNINCTELINYHYKIKTKKTIKLSIICDNNYVVHSHILSEPKKHDSKFILPLIKRKKIPLKKFPYLVGDKGYISKKNKYKLKKMGLKLVTPLRKNQKNAKQINKKNKKILKKRFKVEALFAILKKTYKRLQLVVDRKIINYNTFLIMAITCQFIKKNRNDKLSDTMIIK